MRNIFQMSFGGLSKAYFLRHLFFGSIFFVLFVGLVVCTSKPTTFGFFAFLVLSTLLYPYSRFVYETVVGFIMGENVFFVSALLLLWWKVLTMSLCWVFAIFIAPVGLVGLYIYHRAQRKHAELN